MLTRRDGRGGASAERPFIRPIVSPDGGFLAYQSDESGRPEIYVRPYPTGERKRQVSSDGGASPLWNRQGASWSGWPATAIWSAPVGTPGGDLAAGAPRGLFRGESIGADLESSSIFYNRMYDLSSDGKRFLVAQRTGPGSNEIVYVENPGGAESR